MKVRIQHTCGAWQRGQEVDLEAGDAKYLIRAGYAYPLTGVVAGRKAPRPIPERKAAPAKPSKKNGRGKAETADADPAAEDASADPRREGGQG